MLGSSPYASCAAHTPPADRFSASSSTPPFSASRWSPADQAKKLFYDTELIWAVKLADRAALHDNLAQLHAEIHRMGAGAADSLRMYVASIFLHSLEAVLDEGGSVPDLFPDPIAVYNSIQSRETASEALQALQALEQALGEVAAYLEAGRTGGQRHVVEKAKRYMRRNFGRSELSLSEVAEFVGMSASYLSSLFSEAEGRSFVDYLLELRMQRAFGGSR